MFVFDGIYEKYNTKFKLAYNFCCYGIEATGEIKGFTIHKGLLKILFSEVVFT